MFRRIAPLIVLAACTGSVVSTTEPGTTTTADTTTTTAPTRTTVAAEDLVPPELPDPADLVEAPLDEFGVDGYDFADVDPDLVETVTVRLSIFGSLYSASIWDELVSDGGDEVVAFTLYPTGAARGDPALATAFADAIAESGADFAEASQRTIGGQTVAEVEESNVTWLLWANNTHLFVTAGSDDGAGDVLAAIIEHVRGDEYLWATGDCLYFDDGLPYAPFGTGNVVPCDGPHQWEVTLSATLPDDSDVPFPDDELGERVGASCEEAFFEFIGLLPIDSALNQVFYLPDETEWAEGDRYFACIISRNDGKGEAALTTGTLRGDDTTVRRTIGDCYRRFIDVGVVSCSDPHVFEFIGMASYPGDAGDAYPGGTALEEIFEDTCAELIDDYVTESSVEGASVSPFPAGINAFAWDRGVREVPCFAYALDEGAALEVVGSFSGGWGPLGEADGAIQV